MIDKEVCGMLFQKYHERVYDFCLRYLGNPYSAEDCTQEVFMIMLKKKDTIDLSEYLIVWLLKTAKKVCQKYVSKNPDMFDDIDELSEIIPDTSISAEKPLSEEIYEILDRNDADLLIEYINSGHGERQKIAERMGIRTTALYEKIKRIRKKVSEYLTK